MVKILENLFAEKTPPSNSLPPGEGEKEGGNPRRGGRKRRETPSEGGRKNRQSTTWDKNINKIQKTTGGEIIHQWMPDKSAQA